MAKLNSEIKDLFRQQLAVLATAGSDGIPNVVPKGSLHIANDETLIYSESRCQKTLKNIQENPRVSVLVVDREKSNGYQIKGTAELLTNGDLFTDVSERQIARNKPRPKYVVKIKVDEIYSV